MSRTRAFKETAWVYDLFDYPQAVTTPDPSVKISQGVLVGGAGSTGYDGTAQNNAATYLPVDVYADMYYYRRYSGGYSDHYLFNNEGEWRLGVSADPPDEDFAYFADTGINSAWNLGTGASPVPLAQIGGVGTAGKRSGAGWGANAWYRGSTQWDLSNRDSAPYSPYSKGGVALKRGFARLWCPKTPASWPDAGANRLLDLSKIPNDYRRGGTGNLGAYGKTAWFAYAIQLNGAVEPARWAGICPNTGSDGWFGRNYNSSVWGMERGVSNYQENTSVTITADALHFLVMKATWVYVDGGANDYVSTSLWVDPTPAVHPGQSAPSETADRADVQIKPWTCDMIRVDISNDAYFGALRIGPTYHSVAPGQRS